MGELGYLQHGRDWTITRDAIIRLTAKRGTAFTYGALAAEIEDHDGLKIDGRGYAGALEGVAQHQSGAEPPWTAMIVNNETREPASDSGWPTPTTHGTPTPGDSHRRTERSGCENSAPGASRQPGSIRIH